MLTNSVTSASVNGRTLVERAVADETSISGRGAPVVGSIVVWSICTPWDV